MGDEQEKTKLSDSEKQEIEEIVQEIMEADRRLRVEELVDATAKFIVFTAKVALSYCIIRKFMN